MREVVVDLETTVNGPGNSPEAHYPANRVLMWGWRAADNLRGAGTGADLMRKLNDYIKRGPVRLIGHNLKFDLKYLIREYPKFPWHELDYYCTMYSEYRQSGHKHRFMSLEKACKYRGVPYTKSLDIGSLLAGGLKMEDIPEADLERYVREDVLATKILYNQQLLANGYRECHHNHVLPLAYMELLGLALDVPMIEQKMKALVLKEQFAANKIVLSIEALLEWDDGGKFDARDIKFTAPRTISYMLTGEPSTGLTTGRKTAVFKRGCHPLLKPSMVCSYWPNTTPGHLGYPMPAKKLNELIGATNLGFLSDILEYRKIQKLTGTYFGPFLEAARTQPSLHPKLNTCLTRTGRLSSSSPNGQNMPPEARNVVKSRNGQLREIDFQQLEIVALAHLSRDPMLINDINAGEDIHFRTGQRVMGWKTPNDMNDKDRKLVKNVNFGLIYGGGAKGLSLQTGQPVHLIKELIKGFFDRYPTVEKWQKAFYTEVANNLRPAGHKDGEQIYDSVVWVDKAQRYFYFIEADSPMWIRKKTGRNFSFKPTETKNYPVQGFAGGDIVMTALYELYLDLVDQVNTDIVMTVHDSILVDTGMPTNELGLIMDQVCRRIEQRFNLPFELSFDITSGDHWQ